MALINCPECNRRVSDKAAACPHCGYPLAQSVAAATVGDILPGHRWVVQSQTLGEGRVLQAYFSDDGAFHGVLNAPPNDFFLRSQQVAGTWLFAPPLLILEWDWIWIEDSRAYHEQVPIELTKLSQGQLEGIDKWLRPWRFALAE